MSDTTVSQSTAPILTIENSPSSDATAGYANSVMTRYKDAYLHANMVNRLGGVVKVIAIVLGGIIALMGFISCAGSANAGPFGSGVGELGGGLMFLFGATLGIMGFAFGVLVQSSGQQLKAHLDCAVNDSPFLNDQQRAVVMSLV